jgi:hypothetical protein
MSAKPRPAAPQTQTEIRSTKAVGYLPKTAPVRIYPSPHLPQSAFTPVRIYPSPHFLMVPDRRIPETVPPLRNHIKSANDSEHMHYALLSLWLRGVPHTLLSRLAVAGQQWFRKGRSARLFRIMHRCLVTSRCRCRRSCAGAT